MNAPPPLAAALAGKRRKLPSPMAEPATAMMIASRDPQLSRTAGMYSPFFVHARRVVVRPEPAPVTTTSEVEKPT